jgi:ferredoxin
MFGPELMDAANSKPIWDRLENESGQKIDANPLDETSASVPLSSRSSKLFYFLGPGHFPDHGALRRRKQVPQRDGGTCVPYMATREEKHSTRGRARLLFEMLRGETLKDGWKNEYLKDALDLCLACKACKSECPINVDMATYKAEFLAHYYEDRSRPRAAYSMGLIQRWAGISPVARKFP